MMKLSGFVVLVLLLLECDGANILAFLPVPAISHLNTFRPILRELSNRGHNVTHVTMIPDENANYKQIVLENAIKKFKDEPIDYLGWEGKTWFQSFFYSTKIVNKIVELILSSDEVQNILSSDNLKFDLILTESTLYQDAYISFAHRFNTLAIEVQTVPATFWLNHLFHNPNTFSYVVDCLQPLTDRMNFWERLENTVVGTSLIMLHRFVNLPKHQALVDKYMRYPGWETRPPLIDLLSNISLAILNTHIAMHYPHPNNPNIIEVPTIQIKPLKKLPQDLQSYLDNATEGFIYFSFGSNFNSTSMPEASRQGLISAFAKLPYRFLWKWETESLPSQPSNVNISKWFPQTDILAHKNIKAFISHGGLNSLTEAVYYGVPLVVVPIFADQYKNSKQIKTNGNGIVLDFKNITEESILWAVKEITQHPYQAAAKKRSAILRDNQMSGLNTAMFWIEYVIRHQGATHLRSAAANLAWYQYFLIDVIAFLILVLVLVFLIVYLALKTLFKCLRGRKTEIKISKKNE